MIYILIISVTLSILISGFCSLMEAALYAVPRGYVKHRADQGSGAGKLLLAFKHDMSRPIAAILILNTIANTAGAAVAGWAFGEIYSSNYLAVFSGFFTLAILYISEIIPKTIGVIYSKSVALMIAVPLSWIITVVKPLILVSEFISKGIRGNSTGPKLSQEEFLSLTSIGTEEGALDLLEGSIIKNIVGLDELLVKDILTPRVVVFREEESQALHEVEGELGNWNFSRVPLYNEEEPDLLNSYVTQRDVFRELLKGNKGVQLKELARPLKTIPELARADQVLLQMFEEKEHIYSVVDEHGGLAGIITLEDVIEEIVGREIVDEYDTVSDLRTFAKLLLFTRHRSGKGKDSKE